MAKDFNDRGLDDRGLENQTKGSAKEVEGKVRGTVGDITDNESEQVKGKAKEMEGKVQKKFGESQSDLAE